MNKWLVAGAVSLAFAARAETPTADVPTEAVQATLPFLDWPEANRIALNLAPAGARPFQLLLDTGASDSVLTPRYAKELGVSIRRARDRPYERETVLGRSLQFWVDVESSESASRTGWEYGLLGGTFLADYVLELDFAERRVRFIDPGKYEVPKQVSDPKEAVIPLRVVANRLIAEVSLDGKPVEVMVDTGAPDVMLLSGKSAKRAGFDRPSLTEMRAEGVLGSTESHLAEAESLAIGPFSFAPAPIEVAPHGFYNQGSSSDSLLGYEVLKHFKVRIDYARKRMWLQRQDEEPLGWHGQSWAATRRVGALVVVGEGGIRVYGVLVDSPAAKLGLRAGDEIEFHRAKPRDTELEETLGAIERGDRIRIVRPTTQDEPPEQLELGGEKPVTPAK
ncbi:MAG TPA: aspartyl protease family protein [Myxococcota bacterium]|nr:aspartyl protease family protein [Myxococcota bacterium]